MEGLHHDSRTTGESRHEASLSKEVERRRLKMIGHILRQDKRNDYNTAITWAPEGKKGRKKKGRKKGRSKTTWQKTVKKERKDASYWSWEEARDNAANREEPKPFAPRRTHSELHIAIKFRTSFFIEGCGAQQVMLRPIRVVQVVKQWLMSSISGELHIISETFKVSYKWYESSRETMTYE